MWQVGLVHIGWSRDGLVGLNGVPTVHLGMTLCQPYEKISVSETLPVWLALVGHTQKRCVPGRFWWKSYEGWSCLIRQNVVSYLLFLLVGTSGICALASG